MAKELSEHYDAGKRLGHFPDEMLDENRWLAARHGLDGALVDLPERRTVQARDLARRLVDRLREHAEDLGSAGELEAVTDLIDRGSGAHRQRVVYEANSDYAEVMREIVEATLSPA
jgi:carboxylate-amine ligase